MSQTFWDIEDSQSMSPRRATEILWGDAIVHLRATNGEVIIPYHVVEDIIGEENLIVMADRLANIMNKKVHVLQDESLSCYRLLASDVDSVTSYGSSVVSVSVNDPNNISTAVNAAGNSVNVSAPSPKIPRPPNCFILYRQSFHHEVKAANPGVSNNEISRILGARWNNESDAVRQKYTMLADELKRKHAIEHPDYQYAPRRPSERKRRATRVRNENLTYVEGDPAYEELFGNTQVTQDVDQSVTVDENFMGEMDVQSLDFEMLPPSLFNESSQAIVNFQLSRDGFSSMEYSPTTFTNCMGLESNNHEMLVTDLL